jgi:hypothetical protein
LACAIRQERREGRCGASAERLDEPGARQTETLPVDLLFANRQTDNFLPIELTRFAEPGFDRWGPGWFGPNPSVFVSSGPPARTSPKPSTLSQTISGRMFP